MESYKECNSTPFIFYFWFNSNNIGGLVRQRIKRKEKKSLTILAFIFLIIFDGSKCQA